MKLLLLAGLALSLTAYAQTGAQSPSTGSSIGSGGGSQGTGYAPNDGSAKPGNPGTFATPRAGLGNAAPSTTGAGTDVNGPENLGSGAATPSSGMNPSRTNDVIGAEQGTGLQSSNTDPQAEQSENINRSNTSVTPVPEDTDDMTLQGKTQTGPYRTPGTKQSQEAEELDYRAIPKVDHTDQNASENQ